MVPSRLSRCLALPALLSAASFLTAAPADWSQFRGPGGQGIAAGAAVPAAWGSAESLVWKVDLPGPGSSSPILEGDRIYLTTYSGFQRQGDDIAKLVRHLHCLQRSDGKTVWTAGVPARPPEEDKIREGHGYATSTPLVDGERIYVFFGTTGVLAFDKKGKELWRTEVGDKTSGWGSAASPVLHKDLVIINASVESESLVALNRKTGKEVWRAEGIKEAWNTPILAAAPGGKTELVIAVMQKILAFDPDSGRPLWSCATDINWYMAPSLVADAGVIYCVGGRSGGSLAVRQGGSGDVTATHRLWTGKKGSNVTSPVFHQGHLYWMHENLGIAYCAEAKTGKLVYENRIDGAGQVYASPVLSGGNIHCVTRSGRALVLPAKPEFEVLSSADLERRGMFNSSPAVSGGRLYVRSDKSLYCFGKK